MPWLFEKKDCHELGPQLSKLELSVKEFGEGSENTVLETENEISAFWDALNRPPLREKLLTKIAARRDEARAYFEQQGLFEDVPWAIVDIGWMLRCQRALNDLLRSLGRRESIRGYYLGVQADREPEEKTGPIEALFINPVSGYGKKQSPILFKQVILIENLFCTADHPTVHHYENGPAYNREVNPATRKRFQSLEKAFSAFAEPCADIAPELAEPETAARLIDQLVDGFLNNPQADVICPLKDIEVSALQNDLDAFPAIRPLTVREALHPIFPSGKGAHVMWHRGSVEVSSAGIRRLYFFAYRVRSVRLRIFGK